MAVADVIIVLMLVTISSSSIRKSAVSACYESIISFGDSLADTGNLIHLNPPDKPPPSYVPPYGETFFHHPTGRNSDGRLVIDFIAESLGLPLLQPYLAGEKTEVDGRSFSKGVNFAVAGATVLDYEYLEKRGIHNTVTNTSLGTQLVWFKQLLAKIPDGTKFARNSLVVLGEIGVNDIIFPLIQGTNKEVTQSFAPTIVSKIGLTIEELIKIGVNTMLIPGIFPLGCVPVFLTKYKTSNEKDYNFKTGCLSWLNEVSEYYNELLLKELSRKRELHPNITIIYADYYNAILRFYISPNEFGFTKEILRACCGGGGPYNYDPSVNCGALLSNICDDPSSFASFDGIHFTEAAYRMITQGLLEGPYTTPSIKNVCPSMSRHHEFCYVERKFDMKC